VLKQLGLQCSITYNIITCELTVTVSYVVVLNFGGMFIHSCFEFVHFVLETLVSVLMHVFILVFAYYPSHIHCV
jgi:hypothetical protein